MSAAGIGPVTRWAWTCAGLSLALLIVVAAAAAGHRIGAWGGLWP